MHAIGIESQHRRLRAELSRDFADQLRILHRRRVQADLFRPGLDQSRRIIQRSNPPADAQRHKDTLDDPLHQFRHDLAPLMGGGDVIKDQLIRPVRLIALGLLDRIAGIDMIKELYPLDHPPAIDVQTGDDAFGEHKKSGQWSVASVPAEDDFCCN